MAQNTDESQKTRKVVLTKLGDDWIAFFSIVFNPAVSILILVTIVLMLLQLATPASTQPSSTQLSPAVNAAITLIISLLSGFVGALMSDRWNKITEGGILITRGKSAIRGLKLLLNNVAAIESRVAIFISGMDKQDEAHNLTSQGYDEILDRCSSLEEAVINAIEEWQDIIPEVANLSTQIGLITGLKNDRHILTQQIYDARAELDSMKEKSNEEKDQLLLSLKRKEEELSEVNKRLREQQSKLGETVLGGSSLFSHTLTAYTGGSPISARPTDTVRGIETLTMYESRPTVCPKCGNFTLVTDNNKKCRTCGYEFVGSS